MRADSSADFARALADFAIPGQNMLHATADGNIGHMLALAAPRRPAAPAPDLSVAARGGSGLGQPGPEPRVPARA